MTNEQMLEMYLNFDFNNHKVSTYEDFQTLLKTLHLTKDDITCKGGGDRCFGFTYGRDFNEDTENEWSVLFDNTITLEGDLILYFAVSKYDGKDVQTIYCLEHTYKLTSLEEVVKFEEDEDYKENIFLYKDKLHFVLVNIGNMEERFIVLEDGTKVSVP